MVSMHVFRKSGKRFIRSVIRRSEPSVLPSAVLSSVNDAAESPHYFALQTDNIRHGQPDYWPDGAVVYCTSIVQLVHRCADNYANHLPAFLSD